MKFRMMTIAAAAAAGFALNASPVSDYIEAGWAKTVRVQTNDVDTLIGLPKPYTVPCMADSFQEMYYWDTYFTNVGLLLSGRAEQAKNNCENMAYLIHRYGFMPNGSRTWYLQASQPPFFTRMVDEVFAVTGDVEWLRRMYAAAKKEYDFWMTQRTVDDGLARYYRQAMSPKDMKDLLPWWWDRVAGENIAKPEDAKSIERWATTFRAIGESGWDCTSRFADWMPQEKNPIDLNSLVWGMERDLAKFAAILGEKDEAVRWRKAASRRLEILNRFAWDEKAGMFCDYDFAKNRRTTFVTAAQFYPLFLGLATDAQAERAVKLLPLLECEFGLASSQKEGIHELQWDYPHGWAPLHVVVVRGLLRYGYRADAQRIARKYVGLVDKVFAETGDLWEKYNVTNGTVSITKEYESPRMLGWTAGAYLECRRVASLPNLFIGTKGTGHVTPAATCPFGLVQAGPDTTMHPHWFDPDWAHCAGYQYGDTRIFRFSQTHLSGTGCPSGGDFGILPYRSEPSDGHHIASFTPGNDFAEPGYYSCTLDSGIRVEIAAAPHSVIYRIDYGRNALAKLMFDNDHGVHNFWNDPEGEGRAFSGSNVVFPSPTRMSGYHEGASWTKFKLCFEAEFSQPVKARKLVMKPEGGHGARYVLDFGVLRDGILEIRMGLSANTISGAGRNLGIEIPVFDFEGVKYRAAAKWNEWLGRAEVDPATPELIRESFNVAMYRTAVQPNDIGDVGNEFYSTFSFWDTFRAAHPWYTLVAADRIDGFVNSALKTYERNGYLPIWGLWGTDAHCMIGHHAVPVIVDAYLKGFRGFDAELAWKAVEDSLTKTHRPATGAAGGILKEDWAVRERHGYYPFDGFEEKGRSGDETIVGESVSRLMECCYDDACAARFAAALGKKDEAARFEKRSHDWTNVFDRATGFVRGRDKAGKWREPFNPYELGHGSWCSNDFTEGNAYQYTWHVLHEPETLVAMLGGAKKADARLDDLFTAESDGKSEREVSDVTGLIGQYAHGNEPSHHVAYFYRYTGHPEKTAEIVRQVFATQYAPAVDGLCGNDDCGQMSAWYLFSALGFYPFDPCGGEYLIGAPQVPGATLRLADGKTLKVTARNFGKSARVKSVKWNGREVKDGRLHHSELVKGGELVYEMCDTDRGDCAIIKPVKHSGKGLKMNDKGYVRGSVGEVEELAKLGPRFAKAAAFLRRADLMTLSPGRYGIDGEDVYASISELTLKDFQSPALCEAHDEYVDLQMPFSGEETIGVAARPANPQVEKTGEDAVFFMSEVEPLTLRPGEFALLYPQCAHAPGLSSDGAGPHRKLVIKIRK